MADNAEVKYNLKTWHIEVFEDSDGKQFVKSTNMGFHQFELLGLLEWKQLDIIQQMSGQFKPSLVERIAEKEKPANEKT